VYVYVRERGRQERLALGKGALARGVRGGMSAQSRDHLINFESECFDVMQCVAVYCSVLSLLSENIYATVSLYASTVKPLLMLEIVDLDLPWWDKLWLQSVRSYL